MLRAGGYFVWAAQPVYKHEEVLEEQWQGITTLLNTFPFELIAPSLYAFFFQLEMIWLTLSSLFLARDA